MWANVYVYVEGAIDVENCFHNRLCESEKALLVPVSTKGSMADHECGNWIIIWTMHSYWFTILFIVA